MPRRFSLLALTLLAVALPACGGSSTSPALDSSTPPATVAQVDPASWPAGEVLEEAPADRARIDAQRAAFEADPWNSGVEFDPQRIVVNFKPGLRQASSLPVSSAEAQQLAASYGNAILRENRAYEPLAGAIALQYGIELDVQVYVDSFNMAAFELPEGLDGDALLASLRADYGEYIESAVYDVLCRPCYTVNDPDYVNSTRTSGGQWGHRRIECTDAWDITRGTPTLRIADVDTGVRITHEELQLRVLDPQVEFPDALCDVENDDNTVEDYDSHGTFIAGIIAAEANNSNTIVGVAPDCEVIPIKISNGGTTPTTKMAEGCMLGMQLGARVVNLSWGGYDDSSNLENMVNTLTENGVLFIGAAGNDATTDAHYPSDYVNSVSVGWSGKSDQRTQFGPGSGSNYGSGVDIVAPGESLKSCSSDGDNSYFTANGTSFSAPMVAAAAGLIWTVAPDLTINEVRALLEDTGAPTTGFDPGNPPLRLDVAAALAEAVAVKVVAPPVDQLFYTDSIIVQPDVRGEPDSVQYLLNGELVHSAMQPPWAATIDLSGISFGYGSITIRGVRGADTDEAYMTLLVDNTGGTFPLVDGFDDPLKVNFLPVDFKTYTEPIVSAIKQLDPGVWDYEDVAAGGPAEWITLSTGAYEGPRAMYCGTGDLSYGGFETDALISRRINLTGVGSPTLVFQHRYNIEGRRLGLRPRLGAG